MQCTATPTICSHQPSKAHFPSHCMEGTTQWKKLDISGFVYEEESLTRLQESVPDDDEFSLISDLDDDDSFGQHFAPAARLQPDINCHFHQIVRQTPPKMAKNGNKGGAPTRNSTTPRPNTAQPTPNVAQRQRNVSAQANLDQRLVEKVAQLQEHLKRTQEQLRVSQEKLKVSEQQKKKSNNALLRALVQGTSANKPCVSSQQKKVIWSIFRTVIWSKFKFVFTDDQKWRLCLNVLEIYKKRDNALLPPDANIERAQFLLNCGGHIEKSLCRMRSYVSENMRSVAFKYLDAHPGKQLPAIKIPEAIVHRTITAGELDKMSAEEKAIVIWWVDDMMPQMTAYDKYFSEDIRWFQTITEATCDESGDIGHMPAESEAYGLLVYTNSRARWMKHHELQQLMITGAKN